MGSGPTEIPDHPHTHGQTTVGRLLHNRNFMSLMIGGNLSGWGDPLFDVAIMWYVYTGTRSALQTAGVTVAERIAFIVIGPIAGTFVDRWDRRRTMMATDGVRLLTVLAVGLLALRHELLPPIAFAAVFLLNGAARFFMPARTALMKRLIDQADLVGANGLYTAVGRGNGFLATSAAGAIVAAVGAAWSILMDAASFVFSIRGVAAIRLPPAAATGQGAPRGESPSAPVRRGFPTFASEAVAGLRYCWKDPVLRGISLVAATATAGAAAVPGSSLP